MNEVEAILLVDALPSVDWRVTGATVVSAVNEPYLVRLDIESDIPMSDPLKLLGSSVALTLRRDLLDNVYGGIVSSVLPEYGSVLRQHVRAQIVVEPALAALRQGRNTRIFQEKDVPTILHEVLTEALGHYDREVEVQTQRTYPAREYTVQYQESDFAFVHRLMEEEGILYQLEPGDDGIEKMVLLDTPQQHPAIDGGPIVEFANVIQEGSVTGQESVRIFEPRSTVVGTEVATRHFDWTHPAAKILGQDATDPEAGDFPHGAAAGPMRESYEHDEPLTLHDYNLTYRAHDVTDQQRLRRERQARDALLFEGVGTVRAFRAGHGVELNAHRQIELNAAYTLVRVTHLWGTHAGGAAGHAGPARSGPSLPGGVGDALGGVSDALGGVGDALGGAGDALGRATGALGRASGALGRASGALGRAAGVGAAVGRVAGAGAALGAAVPGLGDLVGGGGGGSHGGRYRNSFVAVPASVAYRPQRAHPRPRVHGIQTAIVTGPAGEEIHTDEHGRVKVQFHWDRLGEMDEKTTCWMRCMQTWAGPGWGAFVLPRVGMEVVVSFIDGDLDRPLITGCVYNGDRATPYELPAKKMVSTFKTNSYPGGDGYNELRFDDTKHDEEIWLHGEKDWNTVIEHDLTRTVRHDERQVVGNNRSRNVGVNERVTVGSNRTKSVGANETLNVGASRTRNVAIDESVTVGQDQKLMVARNQETRIGEKRLVAVGLEHELTSEVAIELRCGLSCIRMEAGGKIVIMGSELNLFASGEIRVNGSKIHLN